MPCPSSPRFAPSLPPRTRDAIDHHRRTMLLVSAAGVLLLGVGSMAGGHAEWLPVPLLLAAAGVPWLLVPPPRARR